MAERRVLYPAALIGSLVFYWAYRQWLSWILVLFVLALPLLSLLVSLWPVFRTRLKVRCPDTVVLGQPLRLQLQAQCPVPPPPVRGRIPVGCALTGQSWKLHAGEPLPTGHCGALRVQVQKAKVCDYLGLFRLPLRHLPDGLILVRPVPVAIEPAPDVSRFQAVAFRPKAGGGFSEHHELRPYRPGDSLHQIHWKLTAKTGTLMLREPMEALRDQAVVSLTLAGTPEQLDRNLGKLLWLSKYLLERELPHNICCLTGGGVEVFSVSEEHDIWHAVDTLLQNAPCDGGKLPQFPTASWHYHIGGDGIEA